MAEETTLQVVQPVPYDPKPGVSQGYDAPMPNMTPAPVEKPQEQANDAGKPPASEATDAPKPLESEAKPAGEVAPDQPPVDDTPPEYKKVITREKNRRQTAEQALEAVRQQNADLIATLKRYAFDPASARAEPKLEDYHGDGDGFLEARANWIADKKIMARDAEARQREQETKQQQIAREHMERLQKAELTDPGVMDLGTGRDLSLPVNDAMAAAIMTSEFGPKILRHLDEHRDDAQRIFSMSPARAAAEIGKIEAALSLPKPKIEPPPKPIEPLGGRGTVVKNKDDPNLTSDEYWALVEAERAQQLDALYKRFGQSPPPR